MCGHFLRQRGGSKNATMQVEFFPWRTRITLAGERHFAATPDENSFRLCDTEVVGGRTQSISLKKKRSA